MTVLRDPKHFEVVDEEQRFELRDPTRFDRIAFAMRALDVLRPPNMTVVVYPRVRDLQVEQGPDRGRGPGASWATVGIPPHASREHIAFELARLAGRHDEPWVMATLLDEGLGVRS